MLGAMSDRTERSRILGSHLPADLGADAARLETMLEVAFLAAASDGELAEVEIDQLVANLQAWIQAELEAEKLVAMFDDFGDKLAADGAGARLAAAAKLLDAESRRAAYQLACVTALCDLDVRDEELSFLGTIADAFGIPSDEAQATFDELDDAVMALAKS
jgi:hypothetical protein